MICIDIPGGSELRLEHLVLDFNGTLALDGSLLPGVSERLTALSGELSVHIVTADTFGNVAHLFTGTPHDIVVLGPENQDRAKQRVVRNLGPRECVAMGNGKNDVLMLRQAALGIGLIQEEGAYPGIMTAANVICTNISDGLDLLTHPLRLAATLRN
ncbi:HAD family hydrolase [Desulfoplanes sp.]